MDNENEAYFIQSCKGNSQLIHRNYRYRCTKNKGNTKYWTCVMCTKKAVTVDRAVVKYEDEHNHEHDHLGLVGFGYVWFTSPP